MERTTRFELVTSTLARLRSTTELSPQGERGGNRTPDGSYVRVLQTRTTHIADSSHSPKSSYVFIDINVVSGLNTRCPFDTHVP